MECSGDRRRGRGQDGRGVLVVVVVMVGGVAAPGGGDGGRMDSGRCRSAGQGAWGQRVESIVCQMQTVGSLRRASLDTPAGRVETRDGESRVNFVEENLEGRSASLRLLDCGLAVSWRARSGRLELNDGQRHLGRFSTKFVNTIGPVEGVGRLRCLLGGMGLADGQGKRRRAWKRSSAGF